MLTQVLCMKLAVSCVALRCVHDEAPQNRRACPILARLILHINVLIEMKICFIILSDSFTALSEFVSRSISGKIGKNLYLLLI